jgi:2-polyprenyl-6-methoxyphenol hydroxylase-like FAD-dependent oxidoreductase
MARVAIVGAGPAGATLGYLLARNGVEVTLLERHRDFQREFRGEVLMPSGLEPYDQMGLWEALDACPHVVLRAARIYLQGRPRLRFEFEPERYGRYAPRWISQPALLEMLVAQAARHRRFHLERGASVVGLVEEGGRTVGLRARVAGAEREILADLVVGADGRASLVRRKGALSDSRDPTPMDVVWSKLPMLPEMAEDHAFRVYFGQGHLLIAAPVHDGNLQMAWIIRKGSYPEVRERGMPACFDEMADHVSPDLAAHLRLHREAAIEPFLLSTVSDRVHGWSRPGLLVIGDAAHTMSPVGAQGINIAIRDAVVAANLLTPVLSQGGDADAIDAAARAVEAERLPEVRRVQRLQAIPPRLILRDTWWSRAALAILTRLPGLGLTAGRSAAVFRRFAFGLTEVRVAA